MYSRRPDRAEREERGERVVAVADGTDLAAGKLARVLTNDPGTGVARHADAGYQRAREVAAELSVRLPIPS